MYQYEPIERATEGSVLEYTGPKYWENTNSILLAHGIDKYATPKNILDVTFIDGSDKINKITSDYFKLIKTKPGAEAKIGNTLMCINKEKQ